MANVKLTKSETKDILNNIKLTKSETEDILMITIPIDNKNNDCKNHLECKIAAYTLTNTFRTSKLYLTNIYPDLPPKILIPKINQQSTEAQNAELEIQKTILRSIPAYILSKNIHSAPTKYTPKPQASCLKFTTEKDLNEEIDTWIVTFKIKIPTTKQGHFLNISINSLPANNVITNQLIGI